MKPDLKDTLYKECISNNLDTNEFSVGWNFIPTAKFDLLVNFSDEYDSGIQESYRSFFVNLWWKRLGAREINVRLYDVQGKEIFTQTANPGQIIRISTKEMANGTYYLRAIPTNNRQLPIELQNIIIQK